MEANLVKDWKGVTLTQYCKYNELVTKFKEKVKDLNHEDVIECEMILLEESKFQYECFSLFSGLPEDELSNTPISVIKDYCKYLDFMSSEPEIKNIKKFSFKGVDYKIVDDLSLNTKYGQYIEAVQSELHWKSKNKDSLMYLAHQLAHNVDFGKDWDGEERDKLAVEFEDLSMDIFLEFSFFLQTKSEVYTIAYLNQSKELLQKSLRTTKGALSGLGKLKQFMSWQSVKYLKDLTVLRLIVCYIQIRGMFLGIWDTFRQKQTMNTSSTKI